MFAHSTRRNGFARRLSLPLIWIALVFLGTIGCSPTAPPSDPENGDPPSYSADISVPEGFDFQLRSCQTIHVSVQGPGEANYPGVKVSAFLPNGHLITNGFTKEDGTVQLHFVLGPGQQEVTISAPAIGIIESEQVLVVQETIQTVNIR